jgi:hypothetical protein
MMRFDQHVTVTDIDRHLTMGFGYSFIRTEETCFIFFFSFVRFVCSTRGRVQFIFTKLRIDEAKTRNGRPSGRKTDHCTFEVATTKQF